MARNRGKTSSRNPAADAVTTKLKAIKHGDSVKIRSEVFRVRSVQSTGDSSNITLELQGPDGGSVTFIGLPKARLELAGSGPLP
ncbi:hypothetical protein NEK97_08350 [Paenarthrobacter sp. UW852]|uniref:hypothetical protein n=1 Tax=Paenarthrobacter sp. UW852 TaxID=2951989 RepID=UPI0021492D4B|nr:hypothetical protein [Paenarthrobacter sp. UW852]MCR1161466.1 hypothetical protein [Paenarthrobacter sp. UW852]